MDFSCQTDIMMAIRKLLLVAAWHVHVGETRSLTFFLVLLPQHPQRFGSFRPPRPLSCLSSVLSLVPERSMLSGSWAFLLRHPTYCSTGFTRVLGRRIPSTNFRAFHARVFAGPEKSSPAEKGIDAQKRSWSKAPSG